MSSFAVAVAAPSPHVTTRVHREGVTLTRGDVDTPAATSAYLSRDVAVLIATKGSRAQLTLFVDTPAPDGSSLIKCQHMVDTTGDLNNAFDSTYQDRVFCMFDTAVMGIMPETLVALGVL